MPSLSACLLRLGSWFSDGLCCPVGHDLRPKSFVRGSSRVWDSPANLSVSSGPWHLKNVSGEELAGLDGKLSSESCKYSHEVREKMDIRLRESKFEE